MKYKVKFQIIQNEIEVLPFRCIINYSVKGQSECVCLTVWESFLNMKSYGTNT